MPRKRTSHSILNWLIPGLLTSCGDNAATAPTSELANPDAGRTAPAADLDAGREPRPLAAQHAWEPVEEARDLFVAERGDRVVCGPAALRYEPLDPMTPTFSIDTSACGYATIAQETLTDIAAGDVVSVRVWHFSLTKFDTAQATLALAIGGDVVWERTLEVPAEGGIVEGTEVVARAAPAGTELQFNLRNHGENHYNLLELTVQPQRP
jgi:hypothetical protein